MVGPVVVPETGGLDRREVVRALLQDRGDMLVVSGLGSPSYDLHAAGDHDGNYYLWGAMGGAALVGFGIAQAQPQRRVLVLTGDGEQLMGVGGLLTISVVQPRNLTIVVLDNGHFGETGMQTSHTGAGIDLAAIANTAGFRHSGVIRDMEAVRTLRDQLHQTTNGAGFYTVKVKAEPLPRSLPPRDAVHIKNRFRSYLGLPVT